MDIQSKSTKMLCTGLSFGIVQDLPVQGKFNFLQNVRVEITGEIKARPRLSSFLTFNRTNTLEVPHSIKTIINKIDDSFNRIVGVGTEIWTGSGAILNQKDIGYSGKPLSIFDFRPDSSTQAYAYIADENKFRKISVDNVVSDVGIIPPNSAATWQIGKPERKIIDSIEAGSEGDWNHFTGLASAPTLETRINTTLAINSIADGALPNFVNIVPTAFTPDIQEGVILKIAGVDYIVEEVIPAALNVGVATIAKISYDAGASGLCTIVLDVSSPTIRRNSILLLNGTENVRVEDVTFNDNGIPSIRTKTTGTFAATNTVSGKASFRIFSAANYVATDTIVAKYIKTVVTGADTSSITRTFNVDLLNTGTKPLTLEDIFHISVLPSDPAALIEIQIQLDVNSGANKFTEQYYYYVINPNFFTGSADQTTPTISIIQQTLQRQQLLAQQSNIFSRIERNSNSGNYDSGILYPEDVVIPGSINETTLGQNQWKEIEIPLKDFIRVGSDDSRTLKDVTAIRVSINSNAAIDISIDSIWVGGADALSSNAENFLAYNYVYRLRNPVTKESSNWSPPLRTGIKLNRGRVELTFADANANYPNTYKIDIARYGGTVNDFRILGTLLNNGSTYLDTSSDRLIADNELAGRLEGNIDAVFDYYKPFTVLDIPKSGTCDVIGTKFIWKTGDKLNTTYPRGTLILIDGKVNKFYSNPTTIEKVELEVDRGNLVGVAFEITDPLLTGYPLPIVFGPFGEGNFGLFYFGLGYKNAAGTVYWLDGNSPSTMSDLNNLEITSPSEPLLAGVIYDGLPYVWSIEKSFQLTPTYANNQFSFIARENANSRGLFSSYAIVSARDYIYHLTENADGIVRVQGNGNPQYITESISNLFYNNGRAPSITKLIDGTEIYPPDYTKKDDLRFSSTKDYIFFRFIDTLNKTRCLVFDERLNDWISYDVYINDKINGIYYEEKESASIILAGIPDGVAKFADTGNYEVLQLAKVIPQAFDAGSANLTKEFKEIVTSADEGINGFTIRNYYNNGDTNDPFIPIVGTLVRSRKRFVSNLQDINGVGKLARNITSIFEWLVTSGTKLYEQIHYWIPQADEILNRSGDIENGGNLGEKLWQGVVIQANTFGQNKTLKYYDDKNVLKATIVINCNRKQTISKSFDQPFISHTIQRTSEDLVNWIVNTEVYVFDIEPESAKVWEGEFNTSDISGLIMFKRMAIAYRSNADSTLKLFFDDGTTQQYDLPNSNEDWHKEFFYNASKKWKACRYRIESEGTIRPYKRHCEIWMKGFTAKQSFMIHQTFGGNSNITDIQI